MKKILVPVLAALSTFFALQAGAQTTVTGDFTVTVNLTPVCKLSSPPGPITVNYTSFDVGTTSGQTTFDVDCTNNWPYKLSLNAYEADSLGLTVPIVIRNPGDTADIAPTDGLVADTAAKTYIIRASVVGPQQGNCAALPCQAVVTRTLTVTY